MLTAEELRLLRRHRRHSVIVIGTIVALALAAFFMWHPVAGAVKGWQSRRHAARVTPLLDEQNWPGARKEALAAYQLRPNEPQALRAAAQYLSRTRQQQALEFWEQLAKLQPLTRDDLRDEATVALISGQTAPAAKAIKSLLERKDAGPREWLLAVQLALQKGNAIEAQRYLEQALATPSASGREQMQAAVVQLAIATGDDLTNAQRRTKALDRLEKLSRGQGDVALDALVILAQRALTIGGTGALPSQKFGVEEPLVHSNDLAHALEDHPLAQAPQKLLALDLIAHNDPTQREALLVRAIDDWKNGETASLVALATWLNGKGEYQRELDTIPLEKALQTRDLYLQHLDALGALGRWSEIKQLLESERFPLDPVIQRMYLARCNAQLGEKTAADNNWQRALEAAGADVQKLLTLADYAENNGALETAGAAYETAASAMPKLRTAQQGRLRIAQTSRDTKKIHAVLADMLKTWPNDTAIQNDEAYTRLLLLPNDHEGTSNLALSGAERVPSKDNPNSPEHVPAESVSSELMAIEKLAENLVHREPASLPHRTLLALARLKQGRPIAALDAYAHIQTTPSALSPSALAVHAAILAAADRRDEAQREIAQAPLEKLLPEEQAVIANLR